MLGGLSILLILALRPSDNSCKISEEISKILQEIWAFWILAIIGFSMLKLFGATLINAKPSPDKATNKVIIITVVFLLCLTLLRAVALGLFWPQLKRFLAPMFTSFREDVLEPPRYMYYLLLLFLMGVSVNFENSIPSKIFHSGFLGPLKAAKARVFRSRDLWFLTAVGWDDVRIGVILCFILALPSILRQVPEPGDFPQLGWGSITVFLYMLIRCFFTTALPEELLFRGFLQTNLTRRFKSTNWGLFLASLAFGLFHVLRYFQLFSHDCHTSLAWRLPVLAVTSVFLGEVIVGLFLGFAFSSRGSLVIPIMIHTSINTISRLLLPDSLSKAVNLLSDWGFLKNDRDLDLFVAIAVVLIATVGFHVLHWWSTTWRPNQKVKRLLNTLDQPQLVKLLQTEEPWRSKKCADDLAQKIVDGRESGTLNSVNDLVAKDVSPEKIEELRGELEILRRLLQEMGTNPNAATLEQLTSVLATKLTKIPGSDSRENAHRAYHLACTIIACRPLAVESLKEPEEGDELDELEKLLVESLKKREQRDELEKLLQETPGKLRELVNAGILVLPS
jgi:membrane protease YdiL (CAAX protease family)